MPRSMLDLPSSKKWAESGGDGCKSRPGPYGLTTRLFIEGCTDNRETAGQLAEPVGKAVVDATLDEGFRHGDLL